MSDSLPSLFDPVTLGSIEAPNRIVMSALTRARATRDHIPTRIMAEYYAQRASAGLIISEAIGISPEGMSWPFAPGLWLEEQVEAWKPITHAVHEAGGRIIAQIWHMGRIMHPQFSDLERPVSASATTAPGRGHTYEGKMDYIEARSLVVDEIPRVVGDYAHAARGAMAANFDGVQIHGANGYLIDQFLRDNTNFRTDDYGGTPENRVRFLREVTEGVTAEIGHACTSVRLSPNGDTQGADDSNPEVVFSEATRTLAEIGIGFLELREKRSYGTYFGVTNVPPLSPIIRTHFAGPLVLNGDYTKTLAHEALASGVGDAISFGRAFIANPDLPLRLARDAPILESEIATWYSRGPEGYTDYPALEPGL